MFSMLMHYYIGGGGGPGGRERERPQGFVCGRPLTPNAWFRRSVSCCHREPVKSCSCPGVVVSEAQRGASWLGPEHRADRGGGSEWENMAVGILGGTVLSQDFSLSWVEKEFPSNGLAWPRMLMSQRKGTEFDCAPQGTGNGLLCLEGRPYQLGNVC